MCAAFPVIALSHGYGPLFFGRLLQGISAGLVGVVVPLYLAECLAASVRGKGTAIFQWMLTLGIVAAALVGMYYSYRVEAVARICRCSHALRLQGSGLAAHLLGFAAARRVFCPRQPAGRRVAALALPPRADASGAHAALLRSRTPQQAALEIEEMETIARTAAEQRAGAKLHDSLLRRKYVIPFLLACVILFCNTATGVNSIIGYNTGILLQSGLDRPAGPLGLRDLHRRQFPGDHASA